MKFRKFFWVLFWLIVWQAAAMLIHNQIMLVGPIEVFSALLRMIRQPSFWQSIGTTMLRILLGFWTGASLALLLAVLSARYSIIRDALAPLVTMIKAIPVASFVILVMIWFGSASLAYVVSTLVVFPLIYINTLCGISTADPQLLEMASVYRMPKINQVRCIYLPALRPFLRSSCSVAIGMAWKSGIAAEVIGQPVNTIGNNFYKAKILLETGDLLAWTLSAIVLSALCERLILLLLREPKGTAHGNTN